MKNAYLKENAISCLLICITVITAIVAYFFLPEQIPMQWSGTHVIWYANKIAILSVPFISIVVILFLKPVIDTFVKKYVTLFLKLSEIIVSGIIFVLFSCEVYTIAYCFGFRWRINYILITEFILIAICCLIYIFKVKKSHTGIA